MMNEIPNLRIELMVDALTELTKEKCLSIVVNESTYCADDAVAETRETMNIK